MKIGIFTAMESEARTFIGNAPKTTIGMFSFYTFNLGRHQAVLCCPPNVGEIAAASATQLLITHFGVDLVLNFGIVGALTAEMSVLSTVLVESVVHYQMDTSPIDKGFVAGQYICFDSIAVPCDEKLLNIAKSVVDLPAVRIASADRFVAQAEEKTALNANFGATICDMESAGILFTCKFNNVPCLMVKCISDSLFGAETEYSVNIGKSTANFFDLATKIVEAL
ncbi:MAG: 5'-methylthioadenosine/S-adenosylhomocysteine nucleosidase [Clostridia bacterium]|nr:5'-methylthioadenosine/S-adenosylhomocysteine nucleosidase [Clostridia bacterium]